jgi:hypothetical protein
MSESRQFPEFRKHADNRQRLLFRFDRHLIGEVTMCFVYLQERKNPPAFLLFQSSAARAALGSDVSTLNSTWKGLQSQHLA